MLGHVPDFMTVIPNDAAIHCRRGAPSRRGLAVSAESLTVTLMHDAAHITTLPKRAACVSQGHPQARDQQQEAPLAHFDITCSFGG